MQAWTVPTWSMGKSSGDVMGAVVCVLLTAKVPPKPHLYSVNLGCPCCRDKGEWVTLGWHCSFSAVLAVLVWPRLQGLAGGIRAGDFRVCVQLLGETAALMFRKIIFHLISLFLASKRFLQTLSF